VLVEFIQRRTLIQALLASAACGFPACSKDGARAEVLRAVIERILVPNTKAAAAESRQLEHELLMLSAEPTVETLRVARASWQRTLLSWKRLDAFRVGPILESNSLLRVMFWPARAAGIDGLLQGAQAIDEASIDAMGVDRRGLFALEYLLFSDETEEQCVARFAGSTGERRTQFARALAANVSFYSEGVARTLGDGRAYARKFADEGQDSVNRLVAQLVYTVENVSANRLARVSNLAKTGKLKPKELEGGPARVSQEIALTSLQSSEALYLAEGQGLCRLVQAQSAVVDRDLRSAFAQAISLVSALGAPLEEAVEREPERFQAASDAVKKLERALKVDLASVLGVTSTFSSVDGD